MQPEDDSPRTGPSPAGAFQLGGAADSSNRPWETESLRIGAGGRSRTIGWVAIAAAALVSLADMALLYSPDGGYGFGSYEPLGSVPRWRLLVGHYLGILLLPAYVAGYWLVHRGLGPAGPWRSWPVFLLGSYAAVLGAACHGLFAPLSLIVQHGGADLARARTLLQGARGLVDPLHGLVNALLVLTSLWFAVTVLSRETRFPRWMAAANPLALALLFVLPYLFAPGSTPALLAAPASFNLAHLVFFALVTAALGRAPVGGDLARPSHLSG